MSGINYSIKKALEKYRLGSFNDLMELYYGDGAVAAVKRAVSPEDIGGLNPKDKSNFMTLYYPDILSDQSSVKEVSYDEDLVIGMLIGTAFEVRYFFCDQVKMYRSINFPNHFSEFIVPFRGLLQQTRSEVQEALVHSVFHLHDLTTFSKFMDACYGKDSAKDMVKKSISLKDAENKYAGNAVDLESFKSLYGFKNREDSVELQHEKYNSLMLASLLCSAWEARYLNNPVDFVLSPLELEDDRLKFYEFNTDPITKFSLGASFYNSWTFMLGGRSNAYYVIKRNLKALSTASVVKLLSKGDKNMLIKAVFYGHDIEIFKVFYRLLLS